MKVGIITFHASHNYGSMLQAYALQQTVLQLGHECHIINLRFKAQKNGYKPFYHQKGWKKKLKAFIYPKLAIDDYKKHKLFETFLTQNLRLTPVEYHTPEELKHTDLGFDAYISGSDQIWNTCCFDHLSSYFLDFVKTGKRIAYAPSMGPAPDFEIEKRFYPFIRDNINRYDALSAREESTAAHIRKITGQETVIVSDPTLLCSQKQWSVLAGDLPIVKGRYILLYTPWYNELLYEQAAFLAAKENIKVVCTTPDAYIKWHRNPYFEFRIAVGPKEFLNLVKHTDYVMCASFHAVVFSLIFGKPFYACKGMDDGRISHLLRITQTEHRAELPPAIANDKLSYDRTSLNDFIEQSKMFLTNALA